MKLHTILIKNYRLIDNAELHLETGKSATILVGPNNSGKTSVAEAISAFLNGVVRSFAFSDFSVRTHSAFDAFENAVEKAVEGQLPPLPILSMELHFHYDDTAEDLNVADFLLMDLDETLSEVRLRIELRPSLVGEIASAFKAFRSKNAKSTLRDFLTEQLHRHYELRYYKVAKDGAAQEIATEDARRLAPKLIRVDFLPAQRHMEDQEGSPQATRLSRLLNIHYERRYKETQPDGYEELETVVRAQAEELTIKYKDAFSELKQALQTFGYPETPDLNIRAELSASAIFKDNTRVFYSAEHDAADGVTPVSYELPERYNGLGFKNLIYMVLQLKAFRDEAQSLEGSQPRVHLVVVEEPEAHLHPQMQTVFLQKAQSFLSVGTATGTQLLITTHSSHITASSGLTPVRYFRRKGTHATIKDLMTFKSSRSNEDQKKAFDFVAQYLTVTRCDLFFCDKAVLVEGAVERLLLPRMLELAAAAGHDLTQIYLSVVEVGGAYAHVFRDFIQFLEVPTLIITDLDSVDNDRKKCPVASGTSSSNSTLKSWLPGKTTLSDIRSSKFEDCTEGSVRIAFQTPETDGGRCGRSFEEAFCYANSGWLVANSSLLVGTGELFDQKTAADLENAAFDLSFPKVDFAIDLILNSGWKTPLYIENGLKWLSEIRA
jgi:putative ATP-dependent endonuclease of the OLD family